MKAEMKGWKSQAQATRLAPSPSIHCTLICYCPVVLSSFRPGAGVLGERWTGWRCLGKQSSARLSSWSLPIGVSSCLR